MATPSLLGREIARLRSESGLGLRAFAARCGLPHSTIQDLESGAQQDATTETVRKIAEACGVTTSAVLEGVERLRAAVDRKPKAPKKAG